MPRDPQTPRLAHLDPVTVAREVAELVADHALRISMRLMPAMRLAGSLDRDGPEHCDLGLTVQDLVRWAQTGEGHADEAWDAAQSVCSVLYSQASEPGTFGLGELTGSGDARTAIGVTLLAVQARRALLGSEKITARALGALAGLDKRWVNRLAAEGKLARDREGYVPPDAARRLLWGRVVGEDAARALVGAGAKARYCCGEGRAWLVVGGEALPAAILATAEGWERIGKGWRTQKVEA